MFTHVMVGSNNLERARVLYDATFAALGGEPGEMDAKGRLIYAHYDGRLHQSGRVRKEGRVSLTERPQNRQRAKLVAFALGEATRADFQVRPARFDGSERFKLLDLGLGRIARVPGLCFSSVLPSRARSSSGMRLRSQ